MNQKALAEIIFYLGNILLRATQQCEMNREMWDRLQEHYAGRMVINKLKLINSLFNMKYSREQNMENNIARMESEVARLASMDTESDDSTKIDVMIRTLKNIDEFERLDNSESVIKKPDQLLGQLSTLFIEEANRLRDKCNKREKHQGWIMDTWQKYPEKHSSKERIWAKVI